MKKIVLYFLTSIAAIWFIDTLLSGFSFNGGAVTIFLVDLFMLVGIYLTEWLTEKSGKKSSLLAFFLIGILLTFFSLYFASLAIPKFSVASGSLNRLKIGFLTTPVIKRMDQILTLVLGGVITMIIATITKWGMQGNKTSK